MIIDRVVLEELRVVCFWRDDDGSVRGTCCTRGRADWRFRLIESVLMVENGCRLFWGFAPLNYEEGNCFCWKNQIPRENVYGRSLGSFGKGENGTHIKRKYVLWNNKSDRYLFLLWLPFEVFRHAFRQWWPISMRQSRNLYIKWKYFWSTSYKDNCMIIYYYNLACTLTTLKNI